MVKAVQLFLAAAVAFGGSPAMAGVTEQALSRCTAAAAAQAPSDATVIRQRIVEGGRETRVSFTIKGADRRAFECRVSNKGELVAAYVDADRPTALAKAN